MHNRTLFIEAAPIILRAWPAAELRVNCYCHSVDLRAEHPTGSHLCLNTKTQMQKSYIH